MMRKNEQKKARSEKLRKTLGLVLGLSSCFFLCACEKQEYKNNTIFVEEETEDFFNYTYVQRGDVLLTHVISCKYVQRKSEDYSFTVKDRIIKTIYVSEGDKVEKGQLLAELENNNVEEKIRDSNYIIDRNQLLIKQVKEQMELELQKEEELYKITSQSKEERNAYNKRVEEIKESYQEQMEEYENTVAIEKLRLDSYQKKEEESKIYARESGTVFFVKPSLVGSFSDPEETIISIVDSASGVYIADDMEYKDYFEAGASVELHVSSGADEALYEIEPVEMDTWEKQMVFTLKDEGYTPKVGDMGLIYIILDQRKDVLYLDNKAIHKANDEYYVYVLDSQGSRVMQPVTIGLQGDSSTEIVDGLNEGEQVILAMNSLWGE